MANIVGTNTQSKCLYCGSTSYGRGCPYAPHKLHVHIDDPQRCIYCSSQSLGMGCPYNPFSKLHVRGIEFNSMLKENIHDAMTAGIFLVRLTQPIKEMECYKMGLIDEQGRVMKMPETDAEAASLTPLDKHILKIRRLIGEDVIDLFTSSALLESLAQSDSDGFNADKYSREVELKSKASHIVDDIYDLYSESILNGFSTSHIEKFLIDSILEKHDSREDKT
jgi:hypothetical protein